MHKKIYLQSDFFMDKENDEKEEIEKETVILKRRIKLFVWLSAMFWCH